MVDGAEFTASCTIKINKIKPKYVFSYSASPGNYTWIMNGPNTHLESTTTDDNQMMVVKLTIKKATEKNKGTYHCHAYDWAKYEKKELEIQFIKRELSIFATIK